MQRKLSTASVIATEMSSISSAKLAQGTRVTHTRTPSVAGLDLSVHRAIPVVWRLGTLAPALIKQPRLRRWARYLNAPRWIRINTLTMPQYLNIV